MELESRTPIWYYTTHYDDYTEEKIESRQEIVDRLMDLKDEIEGSEMLFTSDDIIEMIDRVIYPNA